MITSIASNRLYRSWTLLAVTFKVSLLLGFASVAARPNRL